MSRAVAAAAAVALLLAACGGGSEHARTVGWAQWGGNLEHTFYSPLNLIDTSNVNRLGIAWSAPEGPNLATWETYPVVVGDTIYYTTSTDQVIAANAATGQVRWRYTPSVNFYLAVAGGGGGVPVNRGVSVANGKVYELTFDDKLVALNQATGEKLWQRLVADPRDGYSETTVPIYYNGLIYVGSAEGDAGLRGFAAAYNANTGRQAWRFYTVPAPGQGWMPRAGAHGGGDVWMPLTVDSATNSVYLGTGNPSPDFVNAQRPGCDPHADSTVALDARTGALKWAHTEVCPDVWDYDSMPSPAVFDIRHGGRTVHAVGHASKEGYYWIYDAATGRPLSRTLANTEQSSPRPRPTPAGVRVCPGFFGGIEYTPAAYDPRTRLVYQQAIDECLIESSEPIDTINNHRQGQVDIGGQALPVTAGNPSRSTGLQQAVASGVMTAIDANTGKVVWQDKESKPMLGGSLATGGGIVFAGSDNGNLYAYDARTGKTLASFDLGLPYGAGPITYEINGTQYVAIAAGGSNYTAYEGVPAGGRLVVLRLGGAAVHPFAAAGTALGPPKQALPNLAAFRKLNPWTYVDAASKEVVFEIAAGTSPANDGFNFDGYADGKAGFLVPVGWRVTLDFSNRSATPHSILLADSLRPPLAPAAPPGNSPVSTPAPSRGLAGAGLTQRTSFIAKTPGRYYLACGVPGHVQAGMWDYFSVSRRAKLPALVVH